MFMNKPHTTPNNNIRCLSRDSLPIYSGTTSLWLCSMYSCFLRMTSEENSILVGYFAVNSANLLLMFQDKLSVPSLGVTNPKDKMGPTRCPRSLLRNYYMLHSDREKRSSKLLLSVQTSRCHHMSQIEYKCCINMSQIIKHYYASVDVLQDCSDA